MSARKQCGGGVRRTPATQAGRGGSIPTPPLEFRIGQWQDAKNLILRFHYSGRTRLPMITGTFHRTDRNGLCVAACVFSTTSARWRERVIELGRLVRAPRQTVPLSRLISLTCKEIRRRKIADLLVSYADVGAGHHGGVYQASGWNYHGMRAPYRDGVIWRSKFVPARTANGRWGTNSPKILRAMGIRVAAHFDRGKHLYWRALTPEGECKAERLGLMKRAYPKPKLTRIKRRGSEGRTTD